MIYASVFYRKYSDDALFTPGAGENNGEFYLPYAKLREKFLEKGIELHTPDKNKGRTVAFELHINCRRAAPSAKAYVYLFENPLIRPLNRDRRALARYAKWFTWDGELLTDPRSVRLAYPHQLEPGAWNGPEHRPLFCVMVASNKALPSFDARSQYQTRVRILEWYELHAQADFHLYGQGWDRPPALPGRMGRVFNQLRKIAARILPAKSLYATWRGPIDDKLALLARARFCMAHENCRDLPGYVTEKIFDCFRFGCVPIYVGPKEIAELVPPDCFIDGRAFATPAELDAFLRSIDDVAYRGYQDRIRDFLRSAAAKPYTQEHFVETIVREIGADLGL